jgi:glycosyltransferase involved in cell wall biosynthesis
LRSPFGVLSPLLTHQTGYPMLKMGVISSLLKQHEYDVIHYHNISLLGPAVLGLDPRHYHPGLRQPIKLYTTHEHWLICPNHVLWKFNRRACEKPECLRCVLMAKRPPQLWRYTSMLKRYGGHVDRFLSPSRFTAQMHAERGFPYPVEHLPYFIPPADRDWQNPAPSPHLSPYFLFVGRLEPIKGVHTLIDIWEQVIDRHPDCDLIVVGTGYQEAELKARAAMNPKISSHIHFTGSLSQSELGRYYVHALATLVPSLTYETFGIIIVESFARKTPVIVRNLGALPEVAQEGAGGLIYNTDAELLQAIDTLYQNIILRQELGEKGYQAFRQKWCQDAHLLLYYQIIA